MEKQHMIDKELEQYYSTYRDLFASEGFKLLVQDLTNNATNINSIEATKDANDMYFRKGQMSIIASIVNLEHQITAAEESAEADESEEA
jgi:hypothetical protein|tara:strand:+ start:83 stop:349 length:267 start_codon:yes stop_codon:yes gene_type:complete